jgi:F-type H+-transporting ATPase subunit delta
MKASATQYAQSLYEATRDKSQEEINLAISNFLKVLDRNGQRKLVGNIVRKFEEIYNAENGIVEAQVASREALSGELRNYVSNYVSKKYGAKEVVLNNIIDQNIKGGIVLKVGDEVTDGTVDRQLRELKNCLNH